MLALTSPVVLVKLDVVEAGVAQTVVLDDEGRAIPPRVVERDADRRLDLDGRIVVGPADVLSADLGGAPPEPPPV